MWFSNVRQNQRLIRFNEWFLKIKETTLRKIPAANRLPYWNLFSFNFKEIFTLSYTSMFSQNRNRMKYNWIDKLHFIPIRVIKLNTQRILTIFINNHYKYMHLMAIHFLRKNIIYNQLLNRRKKTKLNSHLANAKLLSKKSVFYFTNLNFIKSYIKKKEIKNRSYFFWKKIWSFLFTRNLRKLKQVFTKPLYNKYTKTYIIPKFCIDILTNILWKYYGFPFLKKRKFHNKIIITQPPKFSSKNKMQNTKMIINLSKLISYKKTLNFTVGWINYNNILQKNYWLNRNNFIYFSSWIQKKYWWYFWRFFKISFYKGELISTVQYWGPGFFKKSYNFFFSAQLISSFLAYEYNHIIIEFSSVDWSNFSTNTSFNGKIWKNYDEKKDMKWFLPKNWHVLNGVTFFAANLFDKRFDTSRVSRFKIKREWIMKKNT